MFRLIRLADLFFLVLASSGDVFPRRQCHFVVLEHQGTIEIWRNRWKIAGEWQDTKDHHFDFGTSGGVDYQRGYRLSSKEGVLAAFSKQFSFADSHRSICFHALKRSSGEI